MSHKGFLDSMAQTDSTFEHIKQIDTDNLSLLADFHVNKNREYTQLQSGDFSASATEISLSNVQVMKESMSIGCRIEAAPADCFLPFAFVSPKLDPYQFCGSNPTNHAIIQASGGLWELLFKNSLEYLCTVFQRDYFIENYELLKGAPPPQQLLSSRISQTTMQLTFEYTTGINLVMQRLIASPQLLNNPDIQRLFCAHLLQLTINALTPSISEPICFKPQSKRQQGVDVVIDYIKHNAHLLPDMQMLCQVAQLSERTLQYGFMERIGMTPIQYLRIIRLNKAHFALLNAHKKQTNVANIALDWGFVEFGRFAKDYKNLFKELPSHTLSK